MASYNFKLNGYLKCSYRCRLVLCVERYSNQHETLQLLVRVRSIDRHCKSEHVNANVAVGLYANLLFMHEN